MQHLSLGKILFGLALIFFGGWMWAYEMGWVDTIDLSLALPIGLMIIGLVSILDALRKDEGLGGGIFLFSLGLLFLLNNLEVMSLGESWPLILIAVGIGVVARALLAGKGGSDHVGA